MPIAALARWTVFALAAASGAALASEPFDRDGYRTGQYRAPVTLPIEGIRAIRTADVAALMARHRAVLIDVYPAESGHFDASVMRWQNAQARDSLPGAHWYPDAGRSPIDPALASRFRQRVITLARRFPRASIVVFCRADCWMSWNAARRLHRWGMGRIVWYADGTDGWAEAGRPLAPATPE